MRNLHALDDSENENECDSSETQVSVSRKTLSNFEELAAHVMSKQTDIGNLANIPIQSQPDIQPSLRNQKPLNQLLNLTALNSITPMETDLQEKSRSLTTKSLEHHTASPLNIPTTNNTSKHTSVAQDHILIPLTSLNLADPPHLIRFDCSGPSKLMTKAMQQAIISPSKA